MKSGWYSIIVLIIYVWAGMLLGISFLEAPLKFQAPGITLPLGLGIGRLVFGALNKIEIVYAIALISMGIIVQPRKYYWAYLIPILVILLLQSLWLLPALDIRAEQIISGMEPSGNSPHLYNVIGEVIKLAALLVFGLTVFKQFPKQRI